MKTANLKKIKVSSFSADFNENLNVNIMWLQNIRLNSNADFTFLKKQ